MQLHIAELSRRGVFKTLVAYAVAAWVLTEVSSVIAPAFLLPDWTVAAVTTILVLGAFPVLLLSWRYDFTLEGIKRDNRSLSGAAERSAKSISALIFVLLLAVTAMLWVNYFRAQSANEVDSMLQAQQGAPEIGETGDIESIAVLPFDDFSPGGGQQLLADGIAEAVLHVLAQNRELVVTSRKSSFMFRDKDVSASEIGRILNVQALLEGSIQIVKDQLRVTSQLIRTSDQAHIWSNVYEAPLDDLFKVNDEIAFEVRNLILPQSKSPSGPAGQAHPPSVEAWQLLLEARELIGDPDTTERAIGILKVVIGLWPDYADAHAWLAMAYYEKADVLRASHTASRTLVTRMRDNGLEAAETALDLDPGNHLAILIKGRGTAGLSIEAYHDAIRTVLELAPNDPDVLDWLAGLALYTADYAMAEELLLRARAVDPGNVDVLESYLWSVCGVEALLPTMESQLRDYPVDRLKALNLRTFAQYCDGRYAEAIGTLTRLARIDSDPGSTFRLLQLLAGLGDDRALALLGDAHRLHPGVLNAANDGIFNPSYFTQILAERLDTFRRQSQSGEFGGGESDLMYATTLMMTGDFADAEKIVNSIKRYWDNVYASEGGRFWQSSTLKIYAFKAWFLARRGETGEASSIARELLQDLDGKNIAEWSESRGRLDDFPLMILLLNGRDQQAVEWLLDAEQDQWLFFQPVATSPVYEEFRMIPEVADSLARMAGWRAGILAEVMAAGLPEVADPSLLLEMMESLVKPSHHERAQITLHFDDDPAGALQHYAQALEQDPHNPAIIGQAAGLAMDFGLVDEAVLLFELAVSLAPEDFSSHYVLAYAYACARRWDAAIASARRAVELNPEVSYVQRWLGTLLILNDEPQAGMEVMTKIEDESSRMMGLTIAHCAVGQEAEADAIFRQWMEYGVYPFHLAYSLAYCGESDLAFEWLYQAATITSAVSDAAVMPLLSNLHDDPRWLPFLESIGKSPEQLAGIEFNIPVSEQSD